MRASSGMGEIPYRRLKHANRPWRPMRWNSAADGTVRMREVRRYTQDPEVILRVFSLPEKDLPAHSARLGGQNDGKQKPNLD